MDTIFVNGTVGAGKTALAHALGSAEGVAHAVIDLDEICRLSPAAPLDPFNHELELQNLASIVRNYRSAGAQRFFLAGVIEHPEESIRYAEALGSTGVFFCRLTARPAVLVRRLTARHADDPDGMRWHLARAARLAKILDEAAIDDLVLDSSDIPAVELAHTVRGCLGWNQS